MTLTVQERAELHRQVVSGQLYVGIRFGDEKHFAQVEAFPDGITWLVHVKRSDGVSQEGCVHGDLDRLESELVTICEQVKQVAHDWQHGPS